MKQILRANFTARFRFHNLNRGRHHCQNDSVSTAISATNGEKCLKIPDMRRQKQLCSIFTS
uniref:Uncharacterized protein n=1 Tax=Serratia marcescens TaxID=615 RepID=U5TUJ6_SERMA|nr:hypothetical protein SME12620_19 [Serratia marcescens]